MQRITLSALISLLVTVPPVAWAAPDTLYVGLFSRDTELAESRSKKDRVAKIPTAVLLDMQRELHQAISHAGVFEQVVILREDDGAGSGWLLRGRFLDFKLATRKLTGLVGLGDGKHKVDLMVEVFDTATGKVVASERVTDGGLRGRFKKKDARRSLAEAVVVILRKIG